MKTLPCLLVATLLLAACSANAQNGLNRIGGFTGGQIDPGSAKGRELRRQELLKSQAASALEARRQPNFAQPFFEAPIDDPHRKLAGKLVSLKPLSNWVATGMVRWAAYQPFPVTNPVPGWTIIEGRVSILRKDAVILARGEEWIALLNWPGVATAVSDQTVRVLAAPAGRHVSGSAAYAAFDYGTTPAAEERASLAKSDAEEASARAESAAKFAADTKAARDQAEAKRKADTAARVAKAVAERDAKEKLEGK